MSAISNFVSLHNHTEYSFLDGAIRIKDLVKRAKEFNMPALAITDHGGMFGAMEFYYACMKEGIKPIIGFEAYVAPKSRFDKTRSTGEDNYNHLILLARNNTGYKNLMQLSSIGYLEGFYYKPRIDMEVLRQYSEGIIATSACIAGAIPRALKDGKFERARELVNEHLSIFGEGNFYLELQNHGIDDELIVFDEMVKLSRITGVPMIVANDAHYLRHEDAASHEILLCIQTQTTMADPKRYRFSSDQIYFKSPAEMAKLFADLPEALANTLVIAERCNVTIKETPQIAKPGCPEPFTSEAQYLTHLARIGLKDKYAHVTPGIEERLAFELSVIIKMGFDGYFLAVRDFVITAKEMGIMTGCRGSAAGSLVAYSVGITDVDPIHYDLIFERFLNPERVSMPDADIDFADRDRAKVIDYVVKKYGKDHVCQIINFGRMKAKMVVRDVARVMGLPVAESGKLAGMVEDSIEKSVQSNGELQAAIKANATYAELFKHARVLEGLARQAGMHAAGVVIAPKPVVNWAPLFKQPDSDIIMTQYDMKYVENAGLIKMDFLGLRTLTVLQDTIAFVRNNHGVEINLWKLPDRDPKTFELFSKGSTVAVFQFESQGMQDNLRKLKPDNIEDLIAMNALYRPGPMEEIPTYILRKHGKEKVEYAHPLIENTLKTTYGVIVYQEQVMRISQDMGGFTMGQADNLRRAMGKKNLAEMEKLREKFMAGAHERKVDKKIAQDIYDRMARFAEYAFNKAHATVYAHVAYQCAYLKAHYPNEFMTANLSSVLNNQDDLLIIKTEAESLGLKILPPDVNQSSFECALDHGSIRLGLGTIKNVGKAAESILAARTDGPFKSLFDLCTRCDLRLVNKKCLESLAYAGALDCLKGTRAQLFAAIDGASDYGNAMQKDKQLGQTNLFDEAPGDSQSAPVIPEPRLPEVTPWPYNELLNKEKEVLNFYVSGHPLDRYTDEIRGFSTVSLQPEKFKSVREGTTITVGGVIASLKTHTQRDGKQMAFLKLEDFDGSVELLVFGDVYEKHRNLLALDSMVLVNGATSTREGDESPKLRVENVMPLAEARDKLCRSVHLRLHTSGLEDSFVQDIFKLCTDSHGLSGVVLHIVTAESNEYIIKSKSCQVKPDKETVDRLREKLGKDNVWLSKKAA